MTFSRTELCLRCVLWPNTFSMFRKSGCHDPRPTTKSAFVKFSFHGIVSMNIDKSNFTVLPCIGYLLQQYSKILKCRIHAIKDEHNDHKYLFILGLQVDLWFAHNQVQCVSCSAQLYLRLYWHVVQMFLASFTLGLLSRSRLSAPTWKEFTFGCAAAKHWHKTGTEIDLLATIFC